MKTAHTPPSHQPASPSVAIVSWMGGEHWYIGEQKFLRLEEAIHFCELCGLAYVVVEDPHHFPKREGD